MEPDVSVEAQYRSFELQVVSNFNETFEVSESEQKKLHLALDLFFEGCEWEIPVQWRTRQHVRNIIKGLNRQATPGHPYNQQYGGTIGELLDAVGEHVVEEWVWQRLEKFFLTGELDWEPDHLFIKQEPHTTAKALQGRWRLIWGNSIVCQVMQRIVWYPSLLAELKAGRKNPGSGPMGLVKGQAHQLVTKLADGYNQFKLSKSDFSAFDMTVNRHVIELDKIDRKRLCINPDEDDASDFWLLYNAVYSKTYQNEVIFGDGNVYAQQIPGIQRSGCFITYSLNSRHNVRVRCLTALRKHGNVDTKRDWLWAAGDDSFAKDNGTTEDDIKSAAAAFGQKCKYVEFGGLKTIGFCSHLYLYSRTHKRYVAVPENWDKHRWHLRKKEKAALTVLPETLESYCALYAFSDEAVEQEYPGYTEDIFKTLQEILRSIAPERVKSRARLKDHVAGLLL